MSSQLNSKSVLKSASGLHLPIIGLGTWQSKDAEGEKAIDDALEAGYRLIDTAQLYRNEQIIGKVLQKWFKSGKLKREEIFVTTKLPPQCSRPALIRPCIEKQLKDLQIEHVNLYLIHHPVGQLPEVEAGSGKFFKSPDPTTDHVTMWKVAGRPDFALFVRSTHGAIARNHAFEAGVASLYNPLEDPKVVKLASTYNKTPGQILLRHLIQSGVAVIPKSVNPERIKQNIQIFDFQLSDQEMADLDALDKGEKGRRFILTFFVDHPEVPYPQLLQAK